MNRKIILFLLLLAPLAMKAQTEEVHRNTKFFNRYATSDFYIKDVPDDQESTVEPTYVLLHDMVTNHYGLIKHKTFKRLETESDYPAVSDFVLVPWFDLIELHPKGIKVERKSMHGLYDLDGKELIPCELDLEAFKEEVKKLAGNSPE